MFVGKRHGRGEGVIFSFPQFCNKPSTDDHGFYTGGWKNNMRFASLTVQCTMLLSNSEVVLCYNQSFLPQSGFMKVLECSSATLYRFHNCWESFEKNSLRLI